jgi:hypothetical protein
MDPLVCQTNLGNTLLPDQRLFPGQAICFAANDEDEIIQFGLASDGHPVLIQAGTIIWEDTTVTGDSLTVEQDSLQLVADDVTAWQVGGCTAPPFNLAPEDHEVLVSATDVRLREQGPPAGDTLWRIDVEDGEDGDGVEQELCPEHELEEGGITAVVVGAFCGFVLATTLLVWVYRRNLGRKTAPDVRHVRSSPAVVAVERQESGDGGNVNHHKAMDNQKTKEADVV